MPGVLGEIKKNDQTSDLSSGSSAPRMAPEPSKNHLEYPGWISTNGASPVLGALSTLGTFHMKKARRCRAFLCPWGHA